MRCSAWRTRWRSGCPAPRRRSGTAWWRPKAGIIARTTAVLDPDEAHAAEALVLGRAPQAQRLRQLGEVRRHTPRLVLAGQLGDRSPAGLILK